MVSRGWGARWNSSSACRSAGVDALPSQVGFVEFGELGDELGTVKDGQPWKFFKADSFCFDFTPQRSRLQLRIGIVIHQWRFDFSGRKICSLSVQLRLACIGGRQFPVSLRRWTRRYSSQRDEFHHEGSF